MTYSQTPIIGLYDIEHLSEENAWDELIDANLRRLEQAVHDRAVLLLAGADVTLDDTPYTGTQAHKKVLVFEGVVVASSAVVIPSRSRLYHVWNTTVPGDAGAYTVTVRTAAGTGPALRHGEYAVIHCDGSNAVALFRTEGLIRNIGTALDAAGLRVANIGAPAADTDAATRLYVDGAVTAALSAMKAAMYPVGHLIVTFNAANPASYLGFGTWVAFGGGTVLMAAGSHTDYRGETRTYGAYEKHPAGEYQHVLTNAEMPVHAHSVKEYAGVAGGNPSISASTTPAGSSGATGAAGGGGAHNNMPPFSVVYVWRRTA